MQGSAIRLDVVTANNVTITPEGFLEANATFGREGILEYRNPVTGATRRELRTPEANRQALSRFARKPVTIEHPPVLLDSKNASLYTKGWTTDRVTYDSQTGLIQGGITVFDAEAIALIRSGEKAEISAGYRCSVKEESGVWKGQRYDAIQENLEINHVCVTAKGRAGPSVRVLLDSADSDSEIDIAYQINNDSHEPKPTPTSMTTDLTRYGLTFKDVAPELATWVSEKFDQFDDTQGYVSELEEAARTDSETIQTLNAKVAELESERDRHLERNDELEELLFNADSVLESVGYKRDSIGEYKKDKGKKPAFLEEMEEGDEDEDEDEGDEEEMPPSKSKKSKKDGKKCDECDKQSKGDSAVEERVKAWFEADRLIPNVTKSEKFDAALDVTGIQKLVISKLRPDKAEKLDSMDAGRIEGYYESLVEAATPTRADSVERSYTDSFEQTAARTRQTPARTTDEPAIDLGAWQKPLTLSR